MSTLKVDAIRHNSATSDAITTASDGTCTAKLTSVGGSGLSHRNKLINGSQSIFQRGTSEIRTGGNDGYYNGIADRWAIRMHSSVGQTTFSQDTSDTPDGFGSSQKLIRANAGSSNAGKYFVYDTKIEGQDLQDLAKGTSSAKEFTLSFYIKTGVSGVYTCELRDLDNTRSVVKQYTVSNGNWNRYTLTFPADTSGTFDNNNGPSLWVRFWLAAGSNFTSGTSQTTWGSTVDANLCPGQTAQVCDNPADTWQITGIQLEVGDTVTTFEHRSFTEELTRCYRYYRRFGANGALPTPAPYNRFSIGYSPSSSDVRFPFQLDPPMRINPVNSNFNKSGNFSIQPGSIGSYTLACDDNSCSANMMIALMGSTSVSSGSGSAVSLHANNDTTAYIEISAEL